MADDKEPDLFADARTPPPRETTELSPLVRRIIAPNESAYTFNGTCTYIVGRGDVAVIDPGPDSEPHLAALLAATEGERIETIVVTHTHRDHSPLAARLRERTGARIVGATPYAPLGGEGEGPDSSHDLAYAPDAALAEGERIVGRGFTLETLATPGHCGNHLCFALLEENALFSGDHVMAWSTSVVIPPDGSMGRYMASLDKLRARRERDLLAGARRSGRGPAALSARADPPPPAARSLDPDRARRRRAKRSRPSSPASIRASIRGSRERPASRREPISKT